MSRVHEGATLYVSLDDTFVARFEELTGLEVRARRRRAHPMSASFEAVAPGLRWDASPSLQYLLAPTRAQVLGQEPDGNPIFTRATYGKGCVYFLAFPLEAQMSNLPGIFQDGPPMWRLYERIASDALAHRALRKSTPLVGITEHAVSDTERIVVLINYSDQSIRERVSLADGWSVSEICRGIGPQADGSGLDMDLAGMDAAVWRLTRLPQS